MEGWFESSNERRRGLRHGPDNADFRVRFGNRNGPRAERATSAHGIGIKIAFRIYSEVTIFRRYFSQGLRVERTACFRLGVTR